MLSMVDSQAVFSKRLKEMNLENLKDEFASKGWNTYGDYCFATMFTPGVPTPPETLNKDIIVPLLGEKEETDESKEKYKLVPRLCKLHFEAYLYMMKDMNNRTEKAEDDIKPVKVPQVERAARLQTMKTKYGGLTFEGNLVPSNSLIDKIATIAANGELRHIKWEELTTRDEEVRNTKVEKFVKVDVDGYVKETSQTVTGVADTSTEMKLNLALKRRGLAMEAGGLMSFSQHEKLNNYFTNALNEEPVKDYAKVSLQQIHDADVEVFRYMAMKTEAGFDVALPDKLPLDDLIEAAMATTRFTQIMAAKQKSGSSAQASSRGMQSEDWAKMKSEMNQLRQQAQSAAAKAKKGNGKGKGKGAQAIKKPNKKKQIANQRMPRDLIGLNPTIEGEKVCYSFNLKGCKHSGNKCERGVHRCMRCHAWDHGAGSSRCPKA